MGYLMGCRERQGSENHCFPRMGQRFFIQVKSGTSSRRDAGSLYRSHHPIEWSERFSTNLAEFPREGVDNGDRVLRRFGANRFLLKGAKITPIQYALWLVWLRKIVMVTLFRLVMSPSSPQDKGRIA